MPLHYEFDPMQSGRDVRSASGHPPAGCRGAITREESGMTANTRVEVTRADVVGSLLRPAYLQEARRESGAGRVSEEALHAVEDRAVLEVIALQEAVGLEVITDGEMRRGGWSTPLRAALTGFTAIPGGSGYRWRTGDPAQGLVRDD